MTRVPITEILDTTLENTLDFQGNRDFSSLPVVENGKFCGIVTMCDLVRVVAYEINKGTMMNL